MNTHVTNLRAKLKEEANVATAPSRISLPPSSTSFASASGHRIVRPSSIPMKGNAKTPISMESIKHLAAKNSVNTARKMVASASSLAPVSLSTKSSIPTGRKMPTSKPLDSESGPSSSSLMARPPNVAPPSMMKTNPGADLASREFTEFAVRVPNMSNKEHNLMKFNGAHKVDFEQWTSVKLYREDNSAQHKFPTFYNREVMPKFGAGSEYGREEREEARRKKYGGNRKNYKKEDQPWILKVGDKINRKFKGLKEGSVSENAAYFVFTQAMDGHFDVYPVKQWYNFTPVQRYKALSAEEAEEVFSRRNKVMNLFSVMVRKRMKVDEEEEGHNKKDQVNRALKMSEMEDWVDDDDDGSAESGDEDNKEKNDKKKKGAKKIAKKKKNNSDDEPLEDSDDGDDEGRELDYISDSSEPSEDEAEKKPDLPGVSDEGGQADTDTSSSENEDDEKSENEKEKGKGENKKKSKKKKDDIKEKLKPEIYSKDDSGVDDAEDVVDKSDFHLLENENVTKEENVTLKRKASDILLPGPSKKSKVEVSSSLLALAASEGITEEAVRKYLFRKPMTVAELLQKFKPKRTKISNEDIVTIIAYFLKKINPTKQTQQTKTYFFLKN